MLEDDELEAAGLEAVDDDRETVPEGLRETLDDLLTVFPMLIPPLTVPLEVLMALLGWLLPVLLAEP